MPIDRGVAGNGPNASPRVYCRGSYESLLAKTVREAIEDPCFAPTDAASDKRLAAEHEAQESALVEAEIELRRGLPVHARAHQLPDGVFDLFRASLSGSSGFTITPEDMVTIYGEG